MKIKFFAIAALAATALLASCDRSEKLNPDDPGKATSMKVTITFPNAPQTRATDDPNATEAEAEVKTVDVFIYHTASGNFASHEHLTAAAFTKVAPANGADQYTANTRIATTTGDKTVFAGVNLPTSLVDAIKNKPIAALSTVAQTVSRDDLVSAANGFAMFSVQGVAGTFVEDENAPANTIKLRCHRLVAKVTVEKSSSMETAGVPGTLINLEFAIYNFNTKIFMLQGAPEFRKDPNWELASWGTGSDFIDPPASDFVSILDRAVIASPTVNQYNPRYAAENTSEGKRKKEITRALVRANFIPQNITQGTTGNFTVVTNPNTTTPQTFWAVTPSVTEGTSYFTTQSIANAFAAEKGGTVLEYTNGLCYWDIFLNKTPENTENRWDVLRNDYYKCNITRIVAPGRNTPDVPDPDNTPEVDTNITTNIEIVFWNIRTSNYVLE